MPLMTQAEYARHRGCSEVAVSKAKKQRIASAMTERRGAMLIDSDKADELWDSTKRANNRSGITKAAASPKAPPAATRLPSDGELQSYVAGLPEDEVQDLNESIKRREHYNAERAKVGALRDREEVGSIAEMKREAYALAKTVREGMLGIIPRVSADLAALTDQFDIERRLEDEILTALRMVADG